MSRRGHGRLTRFCSRAAIACLAVLALGCCATRPPAGEGRPVDPGPPSASAKQTTAEAGCAPARPRACFGPLTTIAGTGTIGGRGDNGWKPAFEGGPALQAELSRPHFAMSDAPGNIYVADKDAHAIRRIAPNGTITTVAGMSEAGDDGDAPGPGAQRHLSRPNGVWVKPDGTLFILDLGNERIRRLSPERELTTFFSVPGLTVGRGLWVSADERTAYVASGSRVMRWTADGGLVEYATGFRQLANLTVDSDGSLLVTDRAAGRLYRVRDGGKRELLAGGGSAPPAGVAGPKANLPGLRAVWPDGNGGLYLGLHQGSAVWYLDPTATLRPLLDEAQVSEVRGLALDPQGNLLIVDHDAGFVRRLRRVAAPNW